MKTTSPPAVSRRADLDWLRVTAFGLLILYHSGMAYSGWSWHVTSPESIGWLRETMRFMNRWRMPLIFMVSGGAIALALGNRPAGAFALDRLKRLLLPLGFGMVVLIPPQVYLERVRSGRFSGLFLEWLPEAYRGVYPAGNMSWHHLWFLAYVLAFPLVLLPLFLWARTASGQAAQAAAARVLSRHGLHWLLVLPPAASILWLVPLSRNTNGLVGDWHGFAYYGAFLIYGAFVFGSPAMLAALNRQRWLSLAIGIVAYGTLSAVYFKGAVLPVIAPADRPFFALLAAVNTLAWLFAAIGLANRYLTMRPRFLAYATEAVYPFYMLHQTVAVIAVYWLLSFRVPPVAGFFATALATFAVTWVIYAGLVRPVPFLRPLFGLKSA